MKKIKKIKLVMIILSLLVSSINIAQTSSEFEEYKPCDGLVNGIGGIEYGNPLIIDDTWTYWTNQNLDEGVVIENGAILKITGTVLMKKFIIVKPHGKLIVEGGTIKSGYSDGSPWHGIYVYGDASSSQDIQYGLHLDNATIKEAEVAIRVYGAYRCSGLTVENEFPYSETLTEYNGGYVDAINSSISDNVIGVHFKEYDFPNLSHFDNCDFFSNGVSIVMDEVYDVLINDGCEIGSSILTYDPPQDLPSAEIVIRNSFANIYDNVFSQGHPTYKRNAIYISGTHPSIHRWADLVMEIRGNQFDWNNNGIEISGLVNTAYVSIDDNLFGISNAQTNIYYNGACVMNTTNNTMQSGIEGVYLKDAGSYIHSEISCNTIEVYGCIDEDGNPCDYGIHAEGNNPLLQMKNNDINASIGIFVNGEVEPEQANIPNQLTDGKPAMNCFLNNNGIDIKAENNTYFVYYYPAGVDPSSCFIPEEGSGFSVNPSQYTGNELECHTPPVTPPVTITDDEVDQKNDTLCMLRDSIDNNPEDIDPKLLYRKFEIQYHLIVDPYLSKKLDEGDYARVEEVLKDACELESKEKLFGFYMSFKDYTKAQQVLDDMVRVGDVRENAFKDIEQIWLDWKQMEVKQPLTDFQVQTLSEVATMDIPERGFARGVLMSTMGMRIWDFDEPNELRQTGIDNKGLMKQIIEIYPNPAENKFIIGFKNNINFSGKLWILDLSGRTILSKQLDLIKGETPNIDISKLKDGNYKVVFVDNNGVIVGRNSFVVSKY